MKNYLDIAGTKVMSKILDYCFGKTPKPSKSRRTKPKAVHVGDFFVTDQEHAKPKEVSVYYRPKP